MERIIEEIREDLDRRIALAADRLTDRTLAEDPAYAALLGRAELRERIHDALRQAVEGLVRRLRGLPVDLTGARATGTLRAGQGLPLASLLRAYRHGGRLLWQVLTEAVAAHDRAALPRLLPGANALWDVLDEMTDAAAEAYRHTESLRGERDRERRAALLDALLDGTADADGSAASRAAAQLGLPDRGRFAVVVVGPGGPPLPAGPGPGADVRGPGAPPRVLWRIGADGETGLVELGHHPLEAVRELLASAGVRAGVSPVVEAPGELARARRLAALALRTVPGSASGPVPGAPPGSAPGSVPGPGPGPGGPRTALLDEHLPEALVAAQAELAARLRQVVLGPVLALPAEDGRVLLSTLGTWLACQGSTTRAAELLYCHRNTVSNRLRRLEQLTGRTLADPAHVVELALAHAAVVQRATGPGTAPPPAGPGPRPADRATPGPLPGARAPRSSPTPAGTARRSPRPRA